MERRNFLKISTLAGFGIMLPNLVYNKQENKILYTFDDSPFELERTSKLVNLLKENNCQTQFYFAGEGIKKQPESIAYLIDNKYNIGWHSMKHDNMTRKNEKEFVEDILSWKKLMKNIVPNYEPKYARFPYGVGKEWQVEILKKEGLNLQPIATKGNVIYNWDVAARDWDPPTMKTPKQIHKEIDSIKPKYPNPIVLLLHLEFTKPLKYKGKLLKESPITSNYDKIKELITELR